MMNLCSDAIDTCVTPYFSIILPIYNVGAYLEQCIQSILNQNFSSYELILVNDGATDNSPEICDEYAAQFEHIQVIHKINGGLSSARNAGVAIARGKYIWWVDADDWIEPDALTILYRATRSEKPDIAKFNFFRVGQKSNEFCCNITPGIYSGKASTERLLNKAFLFPGKFCLSAWGNIYKGSFLEERNLYFVSERIIGSEDYLFNLSALAVAENIQVIQDYLYNYRQREGSLTQRYRENLSVKYTELYRRLREFYHQLGILKDYEGRICNFYVWHLFHGTCFSNEYRITTTHSQTEGRKNICNFLKSSDFQYAVKHCDTHMFNMRQRIQLWAMRMKVEPLFHWLFVVKPQKKKGKDYENSD